MRKYNENTDLKRKQGSRDKENILSRSQGRTRNLNLEKDNKNEQTSLRIENLLRGN